MTNRLFIAFDIPEIIKDKVIETRDRLCNDNKVKWEKRDKLHITAKFLGDTDESLLPGITEGLERICNKYSKIKTGFSRFGLFYKNDKPGILWLGFKENRDLVKLYLDIDDELSKLGFEKERRKFKPHLTILRIKGYEDLRKIEAMASAEIEEVGFNIERVSLYESELKKTGSVYRKIKSFELR